MIFSCKSIIVKYFLFPLLGSDLKVLFALASSIVVVFNLLLVLNPVKILASKAVFYFIDVITITWVALSLLLQFLEPFLL